MVEKTSALTINISNNVLLMISQSTPLKLKFCFTTNAKNKEHDVKNISKAKIIHLGTILSPFTRNLLLGVDMLFDFFDS